MVIQRFHSAGVGRGAQPITGPARRFRPGVLSSVGATVGVVAWGSVGVWRAGHEDNNPWNQTNPIAYGASKGIILGTLAGLFAALVVRRLGRTPLRAAAAAFAGGLLGGALLGTLRGLRGPPDPILYFMDPMPDEQWYWSLMLQHWAARTILPAVACAVALAVVAWSSSRWLWRPRQIAVSTGLLWLAVSLGMFVLPSVIAYDGTIEGNGEHVNESAIAALTAWLMALIALIVGVVRVAFGLSPRRRGRG
ncbi:hypothetical protein HKK72_23245 [Actinomadura sp. HBU206391]|nr:hypothetical protein [Actinomadura sp. HBU206391]